MSNDHTERKPSPFVLLQCKCPRCRRGDMFREKNPYRLKSFMKMYEACPVCGQDLDLEPGFYYGSNYVSYALSVAICAATFLAWWLTIGFSFTDNRFVYWIITNAVVLILLQPPLMRLARTLWLAFFVRYNKDWSTVPAKKSERVIKELANAW